MYARAALIEAYRDFYNNYLSVELYAEHNGLTLAQARSLLALAKDVDASPHPDA